MKKITSTIIICALGFTSSYSAIQFSLKSFKKTVSSVTNTSSTSSSSSTASKLASVASSTASSSLSQSEIANGLKEALSIGSTKASTSLNKENGFFKDAAVKILLPTEAQTLTKNITLIPGGQQLLDDAILRMNRAAEDAAITAKPIFLNAITGMSISDALAILQGSDNAATTYLRKTSYSPLQKAFQPQISTSLEKKLIGNVSAAQAWSTLMNANNKAAKTIPGRMAKMRTINADLSQYVTGKALEGIFIKIADEEKSIRKDPVSRVTDVLKNVFSELD